MITEPMTFAGEPVLEDFLAMCRVLVQLRVRRSVQITGIIVAGLALTMMIVITVTGYFSLWIGLAMACCLFNIAQPFLRPLRWRWLWRRACRSGENAGLTVTITNEDLTCVSPLSEFRVKWQLLATLVEAPRGLLFILRPSAVWFWLPQSNFVGNERRNAILLKAEECQIPIRKLK